MLYDGNPAQSIAAAIRAELFESPSSPSEMNAAGPISETAPPLASDGLL
jgi:hypothetical protein